MTIKVKSVYFIDATATYIIICDALQNGTAAAGSRRGMRRRRTMDGRIHVTSKTLVNK